MIWRDERQAEAGAVILAVEVVFDLHEGSNTRSISAAAMPMPRSSTSITGEPARSHWARKVTVRTIAVKT